MDIYHVVATVLITLAVVVPVWAIATDHREY